ncbi:MAG: hypothetical protein M3R36_10410 [Bacteroidota bacterium]|nr:hypothetical protein [Bacteroidota bacterium]
MAASDNTAKRCIYRIVSANSLKKLEKLVNDMIAQGWNADGSVNGGWEIHGDIGKDGKAFFQVLISCPTQHGATNILSGVIK